MFENKKNIRKGGEMMHPTWKSVCLLLFLFCLTGCSAHLKQRELERVAKDWAMTIRASQVIPVYPLNADLQPGDVFLVQTPISKESTTYRKKGYLPLDLQFARLDLRSEYKKFYSDGYWKGDFSNNPFDRPQRDAAASSSESGKLEVAAPSVAFPNYTFNINAGAGLQLAMPVSSIPVSMGLGLMGANAAQGSIELKEAYTYGLSVDEILPRLRVWALENRAELKQIGESCPDPVFLRIINRVFMVGKITISLSNADALSGGVDIGSAKEVDLLSIQTDDPVALDKNLEAYKKTSSAYKEILNELNPNIPGGSVRISYASRRAVSLEEVFDEPKIIGYLGFDVQVDESGGIGSVIATRQKLENNLKPSKVVEYGADENSEKIRQYLENNPEKIEVLRNWLKDNYYTSISIGQVLNGNLPGVRKQIITFLNISE